MRNNEANLQPRICNPSDPHDPHDPNVPNVPHDPHDPHDLYDPCFLSIHYSVYEGKSVSTT